MANGNDEGISKEEKYLLTIGSQAEELAGLSGVKDIIEQTAKDKRPAYTNPAAAANIINKYGPLIKKLQEDAIQLIKKYGKSLETGFLKVLARMYGNVYSAQQYLGNVDAAANEVRENAKKTVSAIPKK